MIHSVVRQSYRARVNATNKFTEATLHVLFALIKRLPEKSGNPRFLCITLS